MSRIHADSRDSDPYPKDGAWVLESHLVLGIDDLGSAGESPSLG